MSWFTSCWKKKNLTIDTDTNSLNEILIDPKNSHEMKDDILI